MDATELRAKLRDRAASYRLGGPSSEHTAALLEEAADELDRVEAKLAEADKHAEKIEALLEPHVAWDGQPSAYDRLASRLASSEAALSETRDRAVKALEPFASMYDRLIPDRGDWGLANHPDDLSDDSQAMAFPTLGSIRLARQTRSELLEQMGGNTENRANSVGENTPA